MKGGCGVRESEKSSETASNARERHNDTCDNSILLSLSQHTLSIVSVLKNTGAVILYSVGVLNGVPTLLFCWGDGWGTYQTLLLRCWMKFTLEKC